MALVASAAPPSKEDDDSTYLYTQSPEKCEKYKEKVKGQQKRKENHNEEDDNRKIPAPSDAACAEQGV